jgi:hypothetical protein
MSRLKLAVACGLAAAGVSACGTTTKPLAGTPGVSNAPGFRGKIDDPRTSKANRIQCIAAAGLPATPVGSTDLDIGSAPGSPHIHFDATAGQAQGAQIAGMAQGAEVVGSALLYPGQAPDSELSTIENCLDQGVQG